MLRIEDRLQQRWPEWFRGRRARIVRPLLRGIGHWSRLDDIDAFLAGSAHLTGFDFVAACSDHLGLRFDVSDAEVARIPARGRLLVVPNHPSGALDALALLACIGRVRQDVRIVANDLLSAVAPLQSLMLGVRILGGRPSAGSIDAVEAALRDEACVVIFPAGEVSRLGPRGVRDPRWRRGVLRFVRNTGAPVLPVRIEARNSPLFYGVSALYKPAATALLAREMYARRARPVQLRIGTRLALPVDGDNDALLRSLRRQLYAIGTRREACGDGQVPLARPASAARLRTAVAATACLCELGVGQQVRLLRGDLRNPLLREIGRLRELTFRWVGEGTGRSRDLDAFDAHYDHIVLWDDTAARVVGAYRGARGAQVLAQRGLDGLYSASLFRYADAALPRLQNGMELGRSFVVPECWGGRGLDALWQGIGAYLKRYPDIRWLYGPASISAALPRVAREQLVAYFQRYHAGDELAVARRPFAFAAEAPSFCDLDAAAALAQLKAGLAAFGTGVPTLYRQYVELCEAGGARFLAFGVDPDFCNSVDGLVELDLHRLRPHKRRRYLGSTDA
ncbi:GNAT family N-acetyltransferase [Lysobacteraceae bacterium NML93-0792]|nr:GNAT family N-acetyltransferase [Xanthomonadaceae bacterium NML93-0792]PBS16761.1 GNAT family N-acetyltransferase [Xanthomonadaceae bacterium NML93-0793]PBS19358.1 GNAT family N-acetyltransferase [Xanthomonadaceae bacterium NML93-0831]